MGFTDDPLDSAEFYDRMQAYRHVPVTDQVATEEAYQEVKRFIRRVAGWVASVERDRDQAVSRG